MRTSFPYLQADYRMNTMRLLAKSKEKVDKSCKEERNQCIYHLLIQKKKY